jgi:glycosyltransferase involved in cell wall biosynthesis
MMPVIWQSRWGIPIGYAVTSEELALHLDRLGVDLAYQQTPWHMQGRIRQPRLQEIAARTHPQPAVWVAYDQADLFQTDHQGYKIGYTMLEIDGLPPDWVARCNAMDEVWTPSQWGVSVFGDAGVRKPLYAMPLGIDPARFHPALPQQRITDRYTFLSVFEWGARKGPDVLLKAYCRAFTRHDPVLLILRVNNYDGNLDVAKQITAWNLPSDGPAIAILYNRQLNPDQLGSFYRSADCFVLPSRGEGWGMPILEAMACGLPVIATAWSGQTEFLHEGVGFPLRVRSLAPADPRCPYYIGYRWAEPDADQLVEYMRYVYHNRDAAVQIGQQAAREVHSRWTWAHAAQRIATRVGSIG